jgi:Coenzyme PQQ synthesis protein D (PqqD)
MRGQVRLRLESLEWCEVEGEVVALDLRTQMYLAVNRTGAVIWPALDAGAERAELVERLVQRFEVSPERAAADVDAFLADLESRDLLEPASA